MRGCPFGCHEMEASAAVSAVAASWAMARSNGSGLRSTRLRMSAPSTLLHAWVASWAARETGTFFSVRFSSPSYAGIALVLTDRLQALARQQEGLRRVATLVARGGSQSEVFSAVAQEMARCLNVENADVFRYEENGATIVAVAAFAEPGVPDHSVGERLTTEGDNISSKVWRTQRAARMDSWESAAGAIAERVRMLGLRSRVGAPIVVDDRVWGMAVVGNSQPDPLPPGTEERVAEFADLVATAI